jgi:hypothetical protein
LVSNEVVKTFKVGRRKARRFFHELFNIYASGYPPQRKEEGDNK